MAAKIEIKVDAAAALRALKLPVGEMTRHALDAAIAVVMPIAQEEPAPSGKPQPFVSAKQRRFFFMALRKGIIHVPYQRTHAMSGAWQPTVTGDGATITNGHPHAAFAVAKATRTTYFSGGPWKNEDEIAEAAKDKATSAAVDAIERIIGSS